MPDPERASAAPTRLLAPLAAGAIAFALCLLPSLRPQGGDTVGGRLGAAVLACRGGFDLRQIDYLARRADGELPYWSARAPDGAIGPIFGPAPAALGAPFFESLEPGAIVTDRDLALRARRAAAVAVAVSTTLLAAALSAELAPLGAAALALVAAASFAGAASLGQGLWQQTALLIPLTAALATIAWARWRRGLALAFAPACLVVAALVRPASVSLVAALGVLLVLRLRACERRAPLAAVGALLALLAAAPFVAWNRAYFGSVLPIGQYVANGVEAGGGGVFALAPRSLFPAIAGLLASPARGLLVFAPFVVVAAALAFARGPRDARVLAAGLVLHLLLIAAFRKWWGGWALGPRLLAEAVWVAPYVLAQVSIRGRAPRALVWSTAAITVAVGLLGLFRYNLGAWDLRRDPDRDRAALWDLRDSPLVAIVRRPALPGLDAPKGPFAYCARDRTLLGVRLVRAPSPEP